jgi:hypothetical protein
VIGHILRVLLGQQWVRAVHDERLRVDQRQSVGRVGVHQCCDDGRQVGLGNARAFMATVESTLCVGDLGSALSEDLGQDAATPLRQCDLFSTVDDERVDSLRFALASKADEGCRKGHPIEVRGIQARDRRA